MDNQQGKNVELAWLAGFIDGEGSIMFRKLQGKRLRSFGQHYYNPSVRVCNTDEPTLKVVTDILDAQGLPYHISHRRAHLENPKWKQAWDLEVCGMKRCKRWLEVFAPYLRTKQWKAYLMLEWINSRQSHVYGADLTPREMEILNQLRNAPISLQRLHAESA